MRPRLWVVAIKRRLRLQVTPREGMCVACKKGRSDIYGEHQVTCGGRGGLIMRHDSLRDLLKKELENAAFTVELEKNAGSDDRSKPGDIKILRWKEGRDLYIDFSCVNPMAMSWRSFLAKGGVGAAAEEWEKIKIDKYRDKIDERTSDFYPS